MMELSLVTMWILAIISIALVIITAYMGFVFAFFYTLDERCCCYFYHNGGIKHDIRRV